MNLKRFVNLQAYILVCFSGVMSLVSAESRNVILLDGTWQVEQGSMEKVPDSFNHSVVVPGLIDMAKPAFKEVGKESGLRQAFWYRRTFKVEQKLPDTAVLMIRKAKYSTRVYLNGKLIGDHVPCFTPALMDVRKVLKGSGAVNELVIRVGANREIIPPDTPGGWDFEKYLYIPGIYDSVELILTGSPFIRNVQTAADIENNRLRIVAEIHNIKADFESEINAGIFEKKSGRQVAVAEISTTSGGQTAKLDFTVDIKNARLWSPEDPFLYRLELETEGDKVSVNFGMRSFKFDHEKKRAILNGRVYMMRGTNVCAYRFFEDDQRGDKPWRREWVRRLHQKFKMMDWNSIRYCIGFPPDFWYEIADEEGFLIQDEFPIWLLGKAPENPKAEKIIPEYTEWMRHRWNHACVVIWDGQNESSTPETGKALEAVRGLDLSGRPWENGWAEPQQLSDCVESHPYLFIKTWSGGQPFKFHEISGVNPVPNLQNAQKALDVPIVINEYGWLWLNRDGTVTCLTGKVYESILGKDSTTGQRQWLYAKYLAALTEFWRCNRRCAGVLHFCGLGYSRPSDLPRPEGGATSDHFIDLETLEFEPLFEKFLRDAFAPVGLMLDFWDEQVKAGTESKVGIIAINDLYEDFSGKVRVRLISDGQVEMEKTIQCGIEALGETRLSFDLKIGRKPGNYMLTAEIIHPDGKTTTSLREFEVK